MPQPNNLVVSVTAACINAAARLWGVRVAGLENLPKEGPAILAINHASNVDPPLIGAQIVRHRRLRAIGKKELFKVPLLGGYIRALGAIPLDRDRPDLSAMRAALEVLKNGDLFLMAPEGTRGTSKRARTPKPGVGFIAHHSGAPVIPIRLAGTDTFYIPGRMWIRVGKPMRFDPGGRKAKDLRAAYQEFAEALMRHIYELPEVL